MQEVGTIKKLTRKSFLLSLLFHLALLFFLLNISTIFTFKPSNIIEKSPELYIPSYVYKGAITPAPQHQIAKRTTQSQSMTEPQNSAENIQKVENKPSVFASEKNTTPSPRKRFFPEKSILDMSRSIIQHNQINSAVSHLNNTEPPILMIGDKHALVDPLIKLLGQALSANFHYPKIEGIFGAQGRVYVELVLHPEGYISDVQIVQSSEIQDFNAAALYAVNSAPKVIGVDKFLPKAKRFVVGFIFD